MGWPESPEASKESDRKAAELSRLPMETWLSRQKDYPLIGLYAYALACPLHESRKQPRHLTFQVAKTLIVHAFKFQTSNKRPFPPEGHTAICSYCLCYAEDKTLNQSSKSVSVRIFLVLVQQCFPHARMTSTCISCISPSLVSQSIWLLLWLFCVGLNLTSSITCRVMPQFFIHPLLTAEVWFWDQANICGIRMEKGRLFPVIIISSMFHSYISLPAIDFTQLAAPLDKYSRTRL